MFLISICSFRQNSIHVTTAILPNRCPWFLNSTNIILQSTELVTALADIFSF